MRKLTKDTCDVTSEMSNLDEIVNNEINYFLKFLNISFLLNADAYIDHDTHSFDKLFIL